jgi:hypothetical protein
MTAYYKAIKLYDNAASKIKELSIQLALMPKENYRERRSIKAKIDRWKKKRDLYHLQWFLLAESNKSEAI